MKQLSLFLAIVFCFSFVGCSQPTDGTTGSNTTATTVTTGDATDATNSTGSTTVTETQNTGSGTSTTVLQPSGSTVGSTGGSVGSSGSTAGSTKPSHQASSATASSTKTTASTKTTKTTSTTTKTTVSTTKPTGPWSDKSEEVLYGFYSTTTEQRVAFAKSDYVNTVFVWEPEDLIGIAPYNTKGWMYVNDIFNMVKAGNQNWKARFDALWARIQSTGCADALLGWYLDEPTDMASMKAITQYAKEKYNKRFFICFMVGTLSGDLYGGYQGPNAHLSKDNCQYLTDIAVDCYWPVKGNENFYERQYQKLHEVKAPDCKVWYIPYAYSHYDILDKSIVEIMQMGNDSIEHINYMYGWLQKEPLETRGGILVFAYDFDSPREQIYSLYNINEKTNGLWNHVMDRCVAIGKEICSGKWDK